MSLLLCFLSTVTTSSTLCFSFSNSGLIGIDDLPQADSLLSNADMSLNQFLIPNKEDNTLTGKKFRDLFHCQMICYVVSEISCACFWAPEGDLVKVNIMVASSEWL
jgi:hypothetical protein